MSGAPSTNGGQTAGRGTAGRGPGGRFAPGNPGGPGNPRAADVARLRAKMLATVTEDHVALAVLTIVRVMADRRSSDGNKLAAARELLDRVVGRPVQSDVLERIEALERSVGERAKGWG